MVVYMHVTSKQMQTENHDKCNHITSYKSPLVQIASILHKNSIYQAAITLISSVIFL